MRREFSCLRLAVALLRGAGERVSQGVGLSLTVAAYVALASAGAAAAPLPVPCGGGNCGANGPMVWVTSGQATSSVSGTRLDVRQLSDKATLNWAEFNIADGHSVNFQQPNRNAVAVNRIFQNSPSQIFGALTANGQVYLINQNGVVFGPGARVNVSSLIASSLEIDEQALANGILDPQLLIQNKSAFASDGRVFVLDENGQVVTDEAGNPLPVRIEVMQGARLKADPDGNGRVMLLGQQVRNAGSIAAPDGQVVLAAGEKVYLQASSDPQLRGLLVEVDAGGEAWNQVTGQIATPRGNTTLVGLAVNQQGTISATTSVRANGSVRLLARDSVQITVGTGGQSVAVNTTRAGSVRLGGESRTEVLPDATDDETAIDDQAQPVSRVEIMGRQIDLESGSLVRVPGGEVSLSALPNPSLARPVGNTDPLPLDEESRIRLAAGSVIDVSGATATTSVSRNAVTVELRANEFRDAPVQRDGELRGETVTVDARVGTPLADVSGALGSVQRGVNERLSAGGTVRIESQGDIVAAEGSRIDVSGGEVHYAGGVVATSQVITADGRVVDIGKADPGRIYQGVSGAQYQKVHSRWGVVETFARPGIGLYEPGYVEGRDAGTAQFAAPRMVLNGTLRGEAVAGELQRAPGDLPLGGRLVVGIADGQGLDLGDFRAPSVEFRDDVLPLDLADGASFPDGRDRLYLATDYLSEGGFTRTEIYSNESITVGADVDMRLAPGSGLLLQGSRVEVAADIEAPASTLVLRGVDVNPLVQPQGAPRPGVRIADGARLDASGLWVNDTPAVAGAAAQGALLTSGGRVDIVVAAQGGELVIGNDVALIADGGAQLRADGKLSAGKAGQIGVQAVGPGVALETGAGLTLQAYGLEQGGQLTFAANQLRVIAGSSPFASSQRADPSGDVPGPYELSAGIFQSGGFQDFRLTATGTQIDADGETLAPLSIAQGALVAPRTAVRVLDPGFERIAGGTPLGDFSDATLLADGLRPAATLALALQPHALVNAASAGALHLEAGSTIDLDPGARLDLVAPTRIMLDGTVRAPAGTISARLATPSVRLDQGFDPSSGIFVGAQARLDATGTAVLQPNELGLRVGEVLDGGRIELNAERGSIALAAGSVLDVSGTAAVLDIRSAAGVSVGPVTEARVVSSRAGTISLVAPESIALDGSLRGEGGQGASGPRSEGGTLLVGLSRLRGFSVGSDLAGTFPATPRQVLIGGDAAGVPAGENGTLHFDPALATDGGFASLGLQADDRVVFPADTTLTLPGALAIEAPNIIAADGVTAVNLAANTIAVGPRLRLGPAPQAAAGGTATLALSANLVDFFGGSALQGFAGASVQSRTDIRGTGLPLVSGGRLEGSFGVAGDLSLQAAQVYPTSFSDFSFSASGDARATLSVLGNGADSEVPLSAGGRLTLRGDLIRHAGTVRAPLGQIAFEAGDALELIEGSLSSTSAEGQLIPFGRVLSGTDWVYEALPGVLSEIEVPVAKRVTLAADRVSIAPGAVVDVAGGGDLYGYEFVPGPGGSVDALSPAENPNLFAVLPGLGVEFAPYDTQEFAASGLRPGDSVWLSGVANRLPEGRYALLPARYALLPGAVLIEAVDGVRDLQPGEISGLDDGTPVTAGYRFVAGTAFRDSRTSGFAVRPKNWARQLAEYQDSYGNTFFTQRALARDLAPPPLPKDAGSLGLSVGSFLQLDGELRAQAADDGRGARLDLSATNLLVSATDAAAGDDAGVVRVSAADLNGLGAESILLGGSRSDGDGVTEIDISATRVEIAPGAALSAPEILLAARDELVVNEGASLEAQGQATVAAPLLRLRSDGGSALLRVSSGVQVDVAREAGASAAGDILLDGATLRATGSILADAGGTARAFDTTLDSDDVSLASRRIALGVDPSLVGDALALDTLALAGLAGSDALRLIARERIDLYADVSLQGLQDLVLDSPLIVGAGADGAFAADVLTLRNTSAAVPFGAAAGSGVLDLRARQIVFGGGDFTVTGFARTAMRATDAVLADGETATAFGGGLEIATPQVSGTAAAKLALSVPSGRLDLISLPAAPAATPAGLGARFQADARDIVVDTALAFPSGGIRLSASRDLELRDGAQLDLAGRDVKLGSATVHTPGGLLGLVAGGDLLVVSGARFDVSGAAGGADAGVISVFAGGNARLQGTLRGIAVEGGRGGSFQAYAGALDDFAALNAALNTGGFDAARSIETGSGDLLVAAGDEILASEVTLAASGGSLTVAGRVGRDEGPRGSVTLAARDDLVVAAGGDIRAAGDADPARGARVSLLSSTGELTIAQGARVQVQGPAGESSGEVRLRAQASGNDVRIGALDGVISGARAVLIEPVLAFSTAVVDGSVIEQVRSDVDAYMAGSAATIRARLGLPDTDAARIRPGVEVTSDGPLSVDGTWDFASWRFESEPGYLTLRAAGDLQLNGGISDAFKVSGFGSFATLQQLDGPSWSYQLTAGADLASALPWATTGRGIFAGETGSLTLGPSTIVRTGTGSIGLAADRDVVLAASSSLVYTAGVAAREPERSGLGTLTVTKNWTRDGGDIRITAGRDVRAAQVAQVMSGWNVRTGGADRPTHWATDFARFQQGVAALAGGDIAVNAGGDIVNLAATVATSGAERDLEPGVFDAWGGGDLRVLAGGDILSGVYSTWSGDGALRAGGSIASAGQVVGTDVHAILSFGEGSFSVTAAADLILQGVINPTTVAPANGGLDRVYFYTYAPGDRLAALAIGGDLRLVNDRFGFSAVVGNLVAAQTPTFGVYPAVVAAAAPSGDLRLDGSMRLLPAPRGDLQLLAAGSLITLNSDISVLLSDNDPAALGLAANPAAANSILSGVEDFAANAIHIGDVTPARLVAAGGNIEGGTFQLAKHMEVLAGGDIRDLALYAQNTDAAQISLVEAGRDLVLGETSNAIDVGGPGRLQVLAGRNVDLGFSRGIITAGGTRNSELPTATGADIEVWAGLASGPDYDGFIADYLEEGAGYAEALVAYVESLTGEDDLGAGRALQIFSQLPTAEQRPLLLDVFFNELRESGRAAASAGFERGFAAIASLFPESTTFAGALSMFFSQIYTLAGGDVNLLVPGGLLNVGLAKPPENLPVTKEPSDLGIVAQREGDVRIFTDDDVLVNQSRIFTLLGGDIVIWSSAGDIDAGRGAKSAISAPEPQITVDQDGQIQVEFSDAIAGSGIRGILTSEDVEPGDVDLIAPAGEINAGDAGIGSAGNLNLVAVTVVGADNISAGGLASGVPGDGGVGAGLSGVNSLTASATEAGEEGGAGGLDDADADSLADTALGWLEVFVEGFGDDDEDRRKRGQ